MSVGGKARLICMQWTRPFSVRLRRARMVAASGAIMHHKGARPLAQKIPVLGLDIAKLVLHVVGMDDTGGVVLRKRIARSELLHLVVFQKWRVAPHESVVRFICHENGGPDILLLACSPTTPGGSSW